jgi:SAM-dependent methyltransferase
MMSMSQNLYTSGEYLKKNPLWHTDESPWKARYVLHIMAKNKIVPKTICEVGCGAGEVLKLVQKGMDKECMFWGYEISPQAFELCQHRANERLQFKLSDIRQEEGAYFDLILLLDVLEHLEDYFSFLREIQPKSLYKIIQFPLDITVRTVLLGELIRFQRTYGHIHYFTKDVAIQMLNDVGYEVVDYRYTWQYNNLQFIWNENKKNPRELLIRLVGFLVRNILTAPNQLFFVMHKDLAVRVMGGWRLLVLVK